MLKYCCAMVLTCLCTMAGCESTTTRTTQVPGAQPIGNSGVHVSGYVQSGATVNGH